MKKEKEVEVKIKLLRESKCTPYQNIFSRRSKNISKLLFLQKKKKKKRENVETSSKNDENFETFSKYRRISFLRNRNVLSNKRITDSLIRKKRKKREKKKENVKKKKGRGERKGDL